jgi:hypothetical protein
MSSPVLALRAAIRTACAADAALSGLMDTAIHDEAPRGAAPVHAIFGEADLHDASTSTEGGHEQELAIEIWAKPGSAATALKAADRMANLLHDASPTLTGHHLVSLSVTELAVERDDKAASARVTLRLRAVTEPLP